MIDNNCLVEGIVEAMGVKVIMEESTENADLNPWEHINSGPIAEFVWDWHRTSAFL